MTEFSELSEPPQPELARDGYPKHPENFIFVLYVIIAIFVLAGGLIFSYLDRRNKVIDD